LDEEETEVIEKKEDEVKSKVSASNIYILPAKLIYVAFYVQAFCRS